MSKGNILVIGSSNTDMTIRASRLPAPGETILGGEFKMGRGGKGANQAVAAKRLGGNVTFVCKVGNDVFGNESVQAYAAEGMDISRILRSEKPSGTALIMVDDSGENCISVAPGANGDISVEDIRSIADLIRSASYLILQLEIPVAAVVEAAHIAHEAGVCVILNPAPATKLPESIFADIDILTPNQTETAILTGISDDPDKAVARLAELGVGRIVMTRGSKGSAVYENGKCTLVDACKVNAIDATAAGDTFCGALCVGLSEGLDLVEAARFATRASALTVQKMGAQESIPYRKDL
ncbi:MAG: ribokinase [Bacteroidales bacterium]|nr:ribokinase [Rikenellaceae bacterium]MDD6975507.1 ribokinase [Bacteroidales bacterium]MDY3893952.1 ribokinase [Candidatus Cryptobacteroides sp.]MDY4482249.1 ribokinase [Candidatus Cryptobacteroides sp.]MDY4563155.1 ribokinase [Candidatus Cryptobacteroides sp.]